MSHIDSLNILPTADLSDKLARTRRLMADAGLDWIVVSDNASKYYYTGRVFIGNILLGADRILYFVRRPDGLAGDDVYYVHKPENIPDILHDLGIERLGRVGFELNQSSYGLIVRLAAALGVDIAGNADRVIMASRAVKTDYEISKIRESSVCLGEVYRTVPSLYAEGMTDVGLQIEIERISRLKGCLGLFRINGEEMELNMGSVLVGDNADAPATYDFAMGGAGVDPSLPAGANGTAIAPGHSIMVDTNGDFTGYMTDMTRTFVLGSIADTAVRAHRLTIEICDEMSRMARPGVRAADLYNRAIEMVKAAGLAGFFMGHRYQAGFIGHGVGVAINELPVIAPRSRDVLALNNVIAFEPKFVIPGTGAVGIENTYVVRADGLECLTDAPTNLVNLERR